MSNKGRPAEPVPQDIADEIIEWISGGETLRDYCRQEGKPSFRTVYNWIDKDEDFAARFARAREMGADIIAAECLEIADDARNDWMLKEGRDGTEYFDINGEHIQRSKLRIETRIKLLAKWFPQRYGDKVDVTSNGEKVGLAINIDLGKDEV